MSIYRNRLVSLGLKAEPIFPKYCAQNQEECDWPNKLIDQSQPKTFNNPIYRTDDVFKIKNMPKQNIFELIIV